MGISGEKKAELELLETIKEKIEFAYELYGSNEKAEEEMTYGFYTIQDYLSFSSQAKSEKT